MATRSVAPITPQDASHAVARLLPYIIRGPQPRALAARDITQRQFIVLAWLRADGRCRMSILAAGLGVSLPTATGIIQRLVKAGHVRRTGDPTDRRQVVVELTAKGQACLREFQELVQRRWSRALSTLPPRELAAFHRVITTLHRQLQSARAGGPP